jgi:hypothetical protein
MTEDDLRRWHRAYNGLCFEYVLPDCSLYLGLSRDPDLADGEYEAAYTPDYCGRGTIFINPAYCTDEPKAKAALLHEMIHQWQDLCGLRLDHRAVFQAWCTHITSITGLVP